VKILFVADVSIAGVIGGAERVLFEQSTRLARRGHAVHVLTRKLSTHDQNRQTVHLVTEWRYELDDKGAVRFFHSCRRNSRKLFDDLYTRYRFDVINFHQPFSAYGVLQSRKSKTIKKIYTCHSLSFEEFISRNPKSGGWLKKALFILHVLARKKIEQKVLKKSDQIMVLSRFTQDKLKTAYKIPSYKIAVIPGGVDLEKFQPAQNRIGIRKKTDLPEDKVTLFTVRNLVQRMGLDNLIEALSEVKKKAPDILMVIGGDGPLKNDLIKMARGLGIEESIRFQGFIPEDELPDYYKMADLFVLPTKELEGFGLVTLEAMASGVPVVGTPVGGTKEILGQFDPTFLFKDTSASSMAGLIMEKYRIIKEKPDEWKEISKKCRQFVEDNYSWEKHVDALEKYF